jgi:pimeloyl-ACP methyl ester carboxylesterase
VKERDSKIYYKIEGNEIKGTVVLLHGFLGNLEVWNTLIPFFTEDYRVIRIDLPGHGKTATTKETIGMGFTAEMVIAVLLRENITCAHFIGHSMGGYVGLEVLNKKSELVKSLTLFNSTAKSDNAQKKKDRLLAVKVFDRTPSVFINAAIENLFYEPNLKRFPEDVKALQQIALQTPIQGAQASLRGMSKRENHVSLIRETNKPVQIIAGRFDNTVKYDSILEQIENSKIKLVTLESGHMGYIESFLESKNALLNFINTCDENTLLN